MNKKVLYIGGFEMPDKNAAAQRVLSVAKALRECGYDVVFYGITKTGDYRGNIDGFVYEAMDYPKSTTAWMKYVYGAGIIEYIKSLSPDLVFTYNYPSWAQERVIRYCRKHGIKTVGDITEWYEHKDVIKRLDTALRMRWSNWHLDGIIPISHYLFEYYQGKKMIELPPLVDKTENKWSSDVIQHTDDSIHLVYVGSPGVGKDRLDYIIKGIYQTGSSRIKLDVVGINEEQYSQIYGDMTSINNKNITFHGRLPHFEAIRLLKAADFQIFFRDSKRVNNAGFPTKFVESISAGVPVIANKISNITDYVQNGHNSFLIDDPFEAAIFDVLRKVSLLTREEMKQIKHSIDSKVFDYHNYVRAIENYINQL